MQAIGASAVLLFDLIVLGVVGVLVWRNAQQASRLRLDLAGQLEHERESNRELREALAKAEAHSADKTRFFGAASHDLRQPAHALGLYLSLLRKDPPEAERRALIEQIASCTDSLERLLGALLGVTDAETAHLRTRFEAVPLQRSVEAVLVQFRLRAEQKGLRLRNVPTRAWVDTDPAILERILGNLVSNAIRYTDAGTVLVGVRRCAGKCRVVVMDTGIGIAASDQDKVFDDFYQAREHAGDRSHGLGLGLATARRLAKSMGTRIKIDSGEGAGSRFSIDLPQVEAQVVAQVATDEAQGTSHLTVLIIEDDPLVSDALRRLLADWGVRVVLCANGDEAIGILRREGGPDWRVLLDYQLANQENGLQIADRIRAELPDAPPIHLVTGEVDDTVFSQAAARGLTVLRKPLKPVRLRALLLSAPRRLHETVS